MKNSIELRELLQEPSWAKIVNTLKREGFVDTSAKDSGFNTLSLKTIIDGNKIAEVNVEQGRYAHCGYIFLSVKGYEDCTFVWLEKLKRRNATYFPFRVKIFVKRNEG